MDLQSIKNRFAIIGNSPALNHALMVAAQVANTDLSVLINGESGVGKEVFSQIIHALSARKHNPFIAVNCGAIPEGTIDSELFGHEKGSFTGASERKVGKFQFAEGGTLFLDELGDMPVLMQVKLLRVLQEKLFTPVGSNREIESNVRVIAATNRPLEEMIKEGKFREDLFYRLNVIPIFLPSLAERKNDLENLIQTFIKKFNKTHSRRVIGMSPEASSVMKKYDWPGNIRELENVIEHSFILETGNILTLASLPESVLMATGVSVSNLSAQTIESEEFDDEDSDSLAGASGALNDDIGEEPLEMVSINGEALDFNKHKEAFEKEFIIKALKAFKGRINQTALHANIPKKTLLRKIEKYGINAKDYFESTS